MAATAPPRLCTIREPFRQKARCSNARRNYHVFITSEPFDPALLTLRQGRRHTYLHANKLAEACASRTHRRHQRCRPPVLKITQWVLIGSENSLLYSIFLALSRKAFRRV